MRPAGRRTRRSATSRTTLVGLSRRERRDLLAFLRVALTDPRAGRAALCDLEPRTLPSRMPPMRFERCS